MVYILVYCIVFHLALLHSLCCIHAIARLRSIEETIQSCTNTLYRACANASPQDMNDAMIGVSQQVSIVSLILNPHAHMYSSVRLLKYYIFEIFCQTKILPNPTIPLITIERFCEKSH